MQVVVAGLDQVRPGQLRLVCSAAYVDSRVWRARGGRPGGQPYREALDPGTLARERGGALAGGECALRWRVEAVAKAY
jgi:hypothetical protein